MEDRKIGAFAEGLGLRDMVDVRQAVGAVGYSEARIDAVRVQDRVSGRAWKRSGLD